MVSNAAQLILKEVREKHYDLRKLNEHAVIRSTTPILPQWSYRADPYPGGGLRAFTMDEAIEGGEAKPALTPNHTILAEALEKWPYAYLQKVVPSSSPSLTSWISG